MYISDKIDEKLKKKPPLLFMTCEISLLPPSPSLIRFGKMPSPTSNIHSLKNFPFHSLMKGGEENLGGDKAVGTIHHCGWYVVV